MSGPMHEELKKVRDKWLRDYFINTANVWDAWKHKQISYREREETLAWYRAKLHEVIYGPRKAYIPSPKPTPKKEDEWLDSIEI
jgi:hypothetical protein